MVYACITQENIDIFGGIESMKECKMKCEETPECKSIDYLGTLELCYTSKYNSKTASKYFHKPCTSRKDEYQY